MPQSDLVATVENAIFEQIRQRNLAVGDTVCTELALAEALGVSRNIVRESVARLRGMGILTNRRNRGLILTQTAPQEVLRKVLPNFATCPERVLELWDLRFVLEVGGVSLVVSRASEEDLQRIRRAARAYREAARRERRVEEMAARDLAFHKALLDAAHSCTLHDMHQVLEEFFTRTVALPTCPGEGRRAAAEHLRIAEALRARKATIARGILERHLRALAGRLQSDTSLRKLAGHAAQAEGLPG